MMNTASLKKKSPIFWMSVVGPAKRSGTINPPQKERWQSQGEYEIKSSYCMEGMKHWLIQTDECQVF